MPQSVQIAVSILDPRDVHQGEIDGYQGERSLALRFLQTAPLPLSIRLR